MQLIDAVSVGVDTTSGRKAFTYAAVDRDLRLVTLADGELDEVTAFLVAQNSAVVAINAPSHLNAGLVRTAMGERSRPPRTLRGVELRAAERELHARGIAVSGTPSTEVLCPPWIQVGFVLYRKLSKLGFKAFPHETASHQWLETHPHAAFCALLGSAPLPRPTLEGRLQRALALFERGVRIRDPMSFLEEITRHRLLHGMLPMELTLSPPQLDALVAAYTAWLAASKPTELTRLGNEQEGFIALPTPELKDAY